MRQRPQQQIPARTRFGVVHPGRPCQQRHGQNIYRVHNYNETNNLNVNNAPRGYVPPQYNGSNNYRSSGSRPFGNGSNNAGYANGNPGLSYFHR
jgi:hypothetical protein